MKYMVLIFTVLLAGCDHDPITSVPIPDKNVDNVASFTRYQTPNNVNYYVDEFYTKTGVHCISNTNGLNCDFSQQH